MVEITSEEQNKIKRLKRNEDSLWDFWDNIKCSNIQIIGVSRRKEKERVWEKILRDFSWKFPQHEKGNSQSSSRSTKSHIQNKPKEKHAKTHTNQTKIKHRDRILKEAREKQHVT